MLMKIDAVRKVKADVEIRERPFDEKAHGKAETPDEGADDRRDHHGKFRRLELPARGARRSAPSRREQETFRRHHQDLPPAPRTIVMPGTGYFGTSFLRTH
jgi:hypothetical protein